MPYAWYDLGPDECGIEKADELEIGDSGICETFGEAKAALIASLTATRDAYQAAITRVRHIRKDEVT